MKLYIGGTAQGKLRYVLESTGLNDCTDCETCDLDAVFKGEILNHFHQLIRRLMLDNRDVSVFLNRIFEENPQAVILCDEVGNGIVPMDKFEREYREAVGRACCEIAKRAVLVERVYCGIGQRLK